MAIFAVRSNTGTRGLAEVREYPNALKVLFKSGEVFEIEKNGWTRGSGLFNVTMSKDDSQIKFVSPPGGGDPLMVRFKQFGNRQGGNEVDPGVPEPRYKPARTYPSKNGGTFTVDESVVATVILEVVEKGPYLGMTIPFDLPYIFVPYRGTTLAQFEGSARQNKAWEEFGRAAGVDFLQLEIPFSANVLPFIEVKLQEANRIFTVQLNEKGFVAREGVRYIPDWLIDTTRLGEEYGGKKSKKAAARKSKKSKK